MSTVYVLFVILSMVLEVSLITKQTIFSFSVYLEVQDQFHWIYGNDIIIWASSRQNLSSGVCEQQRRRSACASAQTDQRLCYSLTGKYHISTCFKQNFNFLASLCSR